VFRFLAFLRFGLLSSLVGIVAGCGGAVAPSSSSSSSDGGSSGVDSAGDDGSLPDGASRGVDGESPDGSVELNEAGLPVCDQGVCPSPSSVAGFAPTWIPPTGAHQNKCTTAMLTEYYQQCLDPTGGQTCTFGTDPASQACLTCLNSNFTDPVWGPLVAGVGEVGTNTAGCIVLLDPGAMACAQAIEAQDECVHAACDAVCMAGDSSSFDSWVTCSAAANGCGCEPYFEAADCVKALAGAQSPAAPCLVGQTFEDLYYSVTAVFCGP
jgi:hypothetical protein